MSGYLHKCSKNSGFMYTLKYDIPVRALIISKGDLLSLYSPRCFLKIGNDLDSIFKSFISQRSQTKQLPNIVL